MSLQNVAACTNIYASTNWVLHMQKIPPDCPDKAYFFCSLSLSVRKRHQASTIISVSLSILVTFSESWREMDPLNLFVNWFWCTKQYPKYEMSVLPIWKVHKHFRSNRGCLSLSRQLADLIRWGFQKVTSEHKHHWKPTKPVFLFHLDIFENPSPLR